MVERDDIVAQGLAEAEGALEVGSGGLGRPGDIEVVEHCDGGGGGGEMVTPASLRDHVLLVVLACSHSFG